MAQPRQSSFIDLKVVGLHLNPSTFGTNAPAGALTIANNVVIDRPSVVATRRGFSNAFSTLNGTGVSSLFQYFNTKLLHGTDKKMYADPASDGVFLPYGGLYEVPDPEDLASRIRSIEANKNFYFITNEGTFRLDRVEGQPRPAGAPPGLSGSGVPSPPTGFMPDQTAVAYRVVFGYRDFNDTLVLGAPSSRWIVTNDTGGDANALVTFQVPKEIQLEPTNFIYQLYRGNVSPDLETTPDDEMALVFEDVTTGAAEITHLDNTPDNLKGAALYTNVGQDGIAQSNYRPPWAKDICLFKQYTFYANTRTLQNGTITLISAGAGNGTDALVPGDTVVFAPSEAPPPSPFTLTATAGPNNYALGEFHVSDTGDPAFDIQETASNIALVANAFPGNTFLTAYYTSSDTDLPGQLRFDRLDLTVDPFAITSSRSSAWQQSLPVTSKNDRNPNRIYFSKFGQPEAVPLANYMDVGSANLPIERIIPLRDGIMVLKLDGVFRISNADPPFTITPIDYNVRILAPNTAAELDNKVYFLSDQGVVSLTDSDAQIMSFVIDRTIIQNTSPTLYPNMRAISWGIAYQSDKKYILSLPNSAGDIQPTQQYIYNHITEVWTRWTLVINCGLVFRKDGRLYLGTLGGQAPGTNSSYVYQERKIYTNADYVDAQYNANTTTVTTQSTFTATVVITNPILPAGVTIKAGWTILQEETGANARILTVIPNSPSVGFTTLITDKPQNWQPGPVILYVPIYTEVETIQVDCENPGMNKQFNEIVYIFTDQSFSKLESRMSSDSTGTAELDILIPFFRGGWGIDPWGTTPWGGNPSGQGKIRRYIAQKIQRAGWVMVNLQNAEAFTAFGWSGLQIFFKQTSSRQK